MGTSNIDLRREISVLRLQVADLKKECKSREAKLTEIIEAVIPFFDVVSYAYKKDIDVKSGDK